MSGALGGAASGAIGGSVFGPIGTVAGAAIGGLASFLGGQATNAANAANTMQQIWAQEAMQGNSQNFNAEQSWLAYLRTIEMNKTQMGFQDTQRQAVQDWESSMSNTAYQRSVADMKAAGLNPILGVSSGGASTPGVSVPMGAGGNAPAASVGIGTASAAHFSNAIGEGVNTALRALGAINDIRTSNAQVEQIQAQTDKISADTALSRAQLPGAAAASSAQAATAGQLASGSVQQQQEQIANLLKTGANIDANTAAAMASRIQSLASAGYSSSQANLSNYSLDYLKQTGVLPTTSGVVTLPHAIATGVTNAGSAFGSALDGLFNRLSNAVSNLIPNFNSARQGTRPGASQGAPSMPLGFTQ